MSGQNYQVVVELSVVDLTERVNALRNNGWAPQGGVAVDSSGFKFQAMIRIPVEQSGVSDDTPSRKKG